MQSTKFEVSVGMLGAGIYFLGLFGGYIITGLLVGFILLFEGNVWLKKTGVKAIVLMVLFSLLFALVGLVPDTISFIDSICRVFGGTFSLLVVTNIVKVVNVALGMLKTILFIALGFKAFKQSTISIPVIDRLVNKYMD